MTKGRAHGRRENEAYLLPDPCMLEPLFYLPLAVIP
jgi:hypothetical protein